MNEEPGGEKKWVVEKDGRRVVPEAMTAEAAAKKAAELNARLLESPEQGGKVRVKQQLLG